MIRKVWYKATDPYYSDEVQTFIGSTYEDLDNQEYEHDRWLGREHPAGIKYIFDKFTIHESECSEMDREVNDANLRKYLNSKNKQNG